MMDPILNVLAVIAVAYGGYWCWRSRIDRASGQRVPSSGQLAIGFGTNFFDTLGIGNFAPTTALYRSTRMVPDELIPGTMNVGHALPVVLMAFLFIGHVEVESLTLYSMIGAAVLGAWVGVGIVARLPRHKIQIGMAVALLVAAGFMVRGQMQPAAESVAGSLGLAGGALIAACVVIGALGALMTIGVGLYAPCMVLVSMLGMNPKAAFPIMMGACAFLMPVASARFVATGKYRFWPALGLTLGGIPGVLIAYYLVESLSLYWLKWLVVVVVVVTAVWMLSSALRHSGRRALAEGDT